MRAREARVLLPLGALFGALVAACDRGDATPAGAPGDGPRIVSVGPGITETIFALGLGDRVVGVDAMSRYPDAVKDLPQVGYHRMLSTEGILALSPTHLFVNVEAGPVTALDTIRGAKVAVTILDTPLDEPAVGKRILDIGKALGKDAEAAGLVKTMSERIEVVKKSAAAATGKPRALVLYSRGENLLFVAGKNTPPDLMLSLVGAENVGAPLDGMKPLTAESAFVADAEVLIVPESTLRTFKSREAIFQTPGLAGSRAAKAGRLVALDDQLLFALGPRTGEAADALLRELRASG